ncbi:MAG TPA: beta-ketoacyl synthase N-terminal-like domain-containing protein [Candidatus Kryptonia bacterium]|nr:beta-ketoacyl synthase N-terminal-like domain-containing protein [Candidatus Kryptonia bacterium]
MTDDRRVVVTGTGAICGAGAEPDEIWRAVRAGRSPFKPIQQWDFTNAPVPLAAEVVPFDPRALVEDRKVHKLTQRGDLFGLYAAARAIDAAELGPYRDGLDPTAAEAFNDRTGVYVGSGGGTYHSNYDFFPLLTTAAGDVRVFGSELSSTVNPMWLLRTLPNNVLCHLGIRYGFKGPNACVTHHAVGGVLAAAEAAAAIRAGEADRAVAVGHQAGIEPQASLYYTAVGLLTPETLRPFDAKRAGSLHGEGAAALVLEEAASASARNARIRGEILGSGCTSEGEGLLSVRRDGDGLARAIALALDEAELSAADVGMVVAHGNGTQQSDASEAAAIGRIFGRTPPPITAFKWAFGHLTAAAGILDAVLALIALDRNEVPGIATLREVDPTFADLPVSPALQAPRSDIALVLTRGFAGANVALLLRAHRPGRVWS